MLSGMSLEELRSNDLRRLRKYFGVVCELKSSEEMRAHFVDSFSEVVSADLVCWNRFSEDHSAVCGIEFTQCFADEFVSRAEAFEATVHTHPVIERFGWSIFQGDSAWRLSDYVSEREASRNPLIQEFYLHVEARNQISHGLGLIGGENQIITINRGMRDFTLREATVLQFWCGWMRKAAEGFVIREETDKKVERLLSAIFPEVAVSVSKSLSLGEIRALGALLIYRSAQEASDRLEMRLDSYYKHLGSIREKLGLDTTAQLRAAIREIKSSVS